MNQLSPQYRLASDVGGTFTDVVLETPQGLVTAKVPTTVKNPELGIQNGISVVLERAGVKPSDISCFIHGTTLATNALIERKGAKTALITTEGFRDSLEIGYENRYNQYDLSIDKPPQIIPRQLRYTVPERMDVKGNVLFDLDHEAVKALVPVIKAEGVEAIAVGLIHSYANQLHELQVRDILLENGCEAEITLSSEVCPEVREYERFTTTACNAYVQPVMARYLRALNHDLKNLGFDCPFYLMTSGGGMTSLESAIRFPIRLVESGPSGGAVLASNVAASLDERKVLSFDMGGTTAKICIIEDFKPQTARNFEIARSARFQKGSGMPVRIPVVEMIEIGAGGGSIAHIDSLGRLAIGPESSGSVPGPACYQLGGEKPTVTDADLLLGKIDAAGFAEGKMQLDTNLSSQCVDADIASRMDISIDDAAQGICEMVEENMANAARIHSVEQGSDLTQCSMIAFGGAGPLHAIRLAEKLGMQRVIVPPNSSVGSAVGFLLAPIAFEVIRSRYMTLELFDASVVNELFDKLKSEALEIVSSGSDDSDLTFVRSAFMRYIGQGHEIEVPLPNREMTEEDKALIQSTYESHYTRLYGRTIPQRDIEILSWALVVSSPQAEVDKVSSQIENTPATSDNQLPVYLPETRCSTLVPVYQRNQLSSGANFEGPALVVEAQTTTFVTSHFNVSVDQASNLILDRRLP